MDRRQWQESTDPASMLAAVTVLRGDPTFRRKLRLVLLAHCYRAWDWLSEDARRIVGVVDGFVEGAVGEGKLAAAATRAKEIFEARRHDLEWIEDEYQGRGVVLEGGIAYADNVPVFEANLRFAAAEFLAAAASEPPFLPEAIAWQWIPDERPLDAHNIRCVFGDPFPPPAFDPAWRTPAVASIAEAVYAEARGWGEMDSARLLVLSDALEEAGCTDANLLGHLRLPGPHVRGCWAVDLARVETRGHASRD